MTTSAAVAVRYSLENIKTSKNDDSFLFLSEILECDLLVEVAGKDQIINRKTTKIMCQHQFKKRIRTRNCERVIEEDGYGKEMKILNVEASFTDGKIVTSAMRVWSCLGIWCSATCNCIKTFDIWNATLVFLKYFCSIIVLG